MLFRYGGFNSLLESSVLNILSQQVLKELYFTMTLSILVASSGMSCAILPICGWHEAFAYVFALLVERGVCPSGRDTAYEKQSVWYFLSPQGVVFPYCVTSCPFAIGDIIWTQTESHGQRIVPGRNQQNSALIMTKIFFPWTLMKRHRS